jgi:hypothetical protein
MALDARIQDRVHGEFPDVSRPVTRVWGHFVTRVQRVTSPILSAYPASRRKWPMQRSLPHRPALPAARPGRRLLLRGCVARVALRTAVRTELGALAPRRRGCEAFLLALERRCSLAFRLLGHESRTSPRGAYALRLQSGAAGHGARTCHCPSEPHSRQRGRQRDGSRSPSPLRTSIARSHVAQRRHPGHQQSSP